MKFLAVFKDSLREAIDSKVFYVMAGLSSLIILLALTLSFEPQPALDFMRFMALPLDSNMSLGPRGFEQMGSRTFAGGSNVCSVKQVRAKEGFSEGPGSDFVVTIVAHFAKDEEFRKARHDPGEIEEQIRQRFGDFDDIKAIEVRTVRLLEPERSAGSPSISREISFEVVTGPTKVTRRLWLHEPSLFFGALPIPFQFLKEFPFGMLGMQLFLIEDQVINNLGAWLAILVSIVITSFFIPNMLQKGTVDLLLVKPIRRPVLLIFKFLGGLLFIFLNTTFVIVGTWLAVGFRSGIWNLGILATIFINAYFFAILYSVSTLFGVLTRSSIVAILMTCLTWAFLAGIGRLYEEFVIPRKDPSEMKPAERVFCSAVNGIHFVLPRTRDLDILTSRLLMEDLLTANQIRHQKLDPTPISWGESLAVSGIFIAVMLGLSCWRFATTDY
jgi:ABC-type transport system involved in multi-copper enzyme maturation permease subunit